MEEPKSPLYMLTDRAKGVMRRAALAADRTGKASIGPDEFLHALSLSDGIAAHVLNSLDWKPSHDLSDYTLEEESSSSPNSATLQQLAAAARQEATSLGHRYPGTEHLLLALVRLYPDALPNPHEVRHEVLSILGHLE